jgi:hypothetical protein
VRKGNRWAIYAAINAIPDGGGAYAGKEAMQFEVDQVMRSRWWDRICTSTPVRHCRVVYPVAGKWSGAWLLADNMGEIRVRPRSAYGITIAHELTHFTHWRPAKVQNARADERDHDRKFAGLQLEVVRNLLGGDYRKLLLGFYEQYGVRWDPA